MLNIVGLKSADPRYRTPWLTEACKDTHSMTRNQMTTTSGSHNSTRQSWQNNTSRTSRSGSRPNTRQIKSHRVRLGIPTWSLSGKTTVKPEIGQAAESARKNTTKYIWKETKLTAPSTNERRSAATTVAHPVPMTVMTKISNISNTHEHEEQKSDVQPRIEPCS